jgi:colanic acid/amylovoran biosynthesis protein
VPKLVILNQPLNNRGDQAAHAALIRLLQTDPDIHITVLFIGSEQEVHEFTKGIQNVTYIVFAPFLKRWRKFCRRILSLPWYAPRLLELFIAGLRHYNAIIRQADYVLCAPGGICMGGYKDWVHVWNLVNAMALNKKTGIYGRSIGPFPETKNSERIFKKRAFKVLRRADYISLRDQHSQFIAQQAGLKYVPTIDTAFASLPEVPFPEELSFLKNRHYAVFVPNCLYAWHPFFKTVDGEALDGFYRSIIEELLNSGYDVVMLPQLFGTEHVDKPYFQKLASDQDAGKVFVVDDQYDSNIQQRIIRSAKLVIGARYHSIIFAINNRVPFLCLSYEHKMSEALKLLGLEEYSVGLKDLIEGKKYDEFRSIMSTVMENSAVALPRIEKARQKAEQLAMNAFSEFQKSLNDRTEIGPSES